MNSSVPINWLVAPLLSKAESDISQTVAFNPKIWLLILPSSCYSFPCKLVNENLVLDQDSSSYLISLNILITCLLNNVWVL